MYYFEPSIFSWFSSEPKLIINDTSIVLFNFCLGAWSPHSWPETVAPDLPYISEQSRNIRWFSKSGWGAGCAPKASKTKG